MSDTKHVVVTREGLQRMKEELEYKETTEKMKVAEQLKVAISYGTPNTTRRRTIRPCSNSALPN